MSYEQYSDEELAGLVSRELALPPDSALRAIQSDDPDLGRPWAVSLLSARSRHRETQQEITRHRERLRRAATA